MRGYGDTEIGGYGNASGLGKLLPPEAVSFRIPVSPYPRPSPQLRLLHSRTHDQLQVHAGGGVAGDGDAETEAFVECPYCGETNEVTLDPGSGSDQEYVEDCQVCCRAWLMHVRYARDGSVDIEVIRSDS